MLQGLWLLMRLLVVSLQYVMMVVMSFRLCGLLLMRSLEVGEQLGEGAGCAFHQQESITHAFYDEALLIDVAKHHLHQCYLLLQFLDGLGFQHVVAPAADEQHHANQHFFLPEGRVQDLECLGGR